MWFKFTSIRRHPISCDFPYFQKVNLRIITSRFFLSRLCFSFDLLSSKTRNFMETNALNWPSQRNKRKWAIIWLLFIFIMILISSCAVQPRYHNRGFHVTFSQPSKRQNIALAQKSAHRSKTTDTARAMHIPANLINAGGDEWWLYHKRLTDSIIKPLRTMTIVGDTFTMHGKLVGANENGIFLYNPHEPLFWVSKRTYGKMQTAIREHVLYVPYKNINKIKTGGTLASRLERILDLLFKTLFWALGVIGSIFGIITADNTIFSGSSTLEVIIVVAAILAFIAALTVTILLSIVLVPIVFLAMLPFSRIKGRFWAINKKASRGKAFFEFIKARNQRYRLYKDNF